MRGAECASPSQGQDSHSQVQSSKRLEGREAGSPESRRWEAESLGRVWPPLGQTGSCRGGLPGPDGRCHLGRAWEGLQKPFHMLWVKDNIVAFIHSTLSCEHLGNAREGGGGRRTQGEGVNPTEPPTPTPEGHGQGHEQETGCQRAMQTTESGGRERVGNREGGGET